MLTVLRRSRDLTLAFAVGLLVFTGCAAPPKRPATLTPGDYTYAKKQTAWQIRKLMQENRPAILHGAKVGVASIITAGWFERINRISKHEITELVSHAVAPINYLFENEVRSVFGENAEEIIKEQAIAV